MLRLEDVENKQEVLQEFFEWLFDDNRITDKSISLHNEIDLSLCAHYSDANIYYPEQIKKFFDTKAMRRLGRISQLGLVINTFPNSYHSRLEHSKGVYNKKVEEFFYRFQEDSWKKYIEDNNQKLYLIAELIKMAGHDIGHLPISHALETQIIRKRGAHEEIGQRIMLENDEIQKTLSSISPNLNSALTELYNNNLLNFKEHDESNYDVDRLDYLIRDSLYLGSDFHTSIQNYKSIRVEIDENNLPKCNSDYSISETDYGNTYIDVYDFSSLTEIEKVLELRAQQYKDVYMSSKTQIFESNIKNFLDAFLSSNSDVGKDLRDFLSQLYNANTENINLDDFINWDEITFYSELLDVAKYHENSNIRNLATMIIPNMSAFLTLMYSFLNLHTKNQIYSEKDKKFLQKIKCLINDNSDLATNLRNKKYIFTNIIFLPEDTPLLDSEERQLITSYSYKIKPYKKSEPIYVRDEKGKIFDLSHHPNSRYNGNTENLILHLSFVSIPYLQFNGVSEDTIDKLKGFYPTTLDLFKNNKKTGVNMQPLKVGHVIEDEFLEL